MQTPHKKPCPEPPPRRIDWDLLEYQDPSLRPLDDIGRMLSEEGKAFIHGLPFSELQKVARWWKKNKPPSDDEIEKYIREHRR